MTEKRRNTEVSNLIAINKALHSFVQKIKNERSVHTNVEEVTYLNFFKDKMLIIQTIRQGIPYTLFSEIKNVTPFSEDDWAGYLDVSKKTLTRHRNTTDYIFKSIHTEKIIELAEVTSFGNEVFDSPEQFYLWLNTPSHALGSLKPSELLKDSYGKELVMAELNRIEHGIFA